MATNEENGLLLVAAGVAVWLITSGKLDSLFGKKDDGPGSANGKPPRPNAQTGGSVRDKFDALNTGGCAAIAKKGGVASAGAGCSAFIKYATPIGWGEIGYDYGKKAVTKVLPESWQFGSSKVGRAKNGKDVFPNDMQECAKRGITDLNGCGALYDLTARKWPWEPDSVGISRGGKIRR